MGQRVRGVVAPARGARVELVTVEVPDPGPGEVLVRVRACGVCHTDLHYREGAINDRFPFLLGHEAAGTVEAVGPGVPGLAPGDHVVLAWRAPCGQCRSCLRGRPWHCFDSRTADQPMTLEDGTPLTAAIGIGAFAEVCLVAAGQAVRVDPAARPEAAALVGCGIMAGFGAIVNTARLGPGDTVAVFGCGGVGNAAVHAAALVGARKVIAVDIDRRKLALAAELGATDLVDSSQVNPVSAVRELTGGFGADVTVEAVGNPEVMKQAFHARDHAGTMVQLGVPNPTMRVDLRMLDFYGRGGSLRPSWYGDCLPTRDFPIVIDLYLRGRYDLDRFVSETIALDQVEEAFAKMQRNEVLRSVVVFDDGPAGPWSAAPPSSGGG
jgi:S-(hydroxymethyl)mycothiol dehydrogenase